MNKEQRIALAVEAGMTVDENIDFEDGVSFSCGISSLERFAALVAAHEREQCALVAISHCYDLSEGNAIAAAIRGRK